MIRIWTPDTIFNEIPTHHATQGFRNAMHKAGIPFRGELFEDGKIHRFSIDKRGHKNCWYVSYGMAGAFGDEAEACLKEEHGAMSWKIREMMDLQLTNLLDLYKDGLKQREIAEELGLGLGTVNRWIKRAKEEGKVK